MRHFSRREFLRQAGGITLVGAAGGFILSGCVPIRPIERPAGAIPAAGATTAPVAEQAFEPDVEFEVTAAPGEVAILPGSATRVWSYQARLLKGDPAHMLPLANTFLGPILRVRKGEKVRVRFRNSLPESSIIHWHGLLVPERMDGHPRDAVQPGEEYLYEFEVVNRAGTYWYHPHPEPLTGGQVNRGLAGLFIVTDDEEEAAALPDGAQDLPLVIQDRTFDADNQFVYIQGGAMAAMPGMASMEMLMGFLGERILVNGVPDAVLPVATRAYRLRLLNGSNSRVYKLAWSNGAPLTVIATDGGLLERPLERPFVMLGPGERIDLWADFSALPVGTEVTLQSLAFLGAEGDSLLEATAAATAGDDAMEGAGVVLPTPTPDALNVHAAMPGMDMNTPAPAAAPTPEPAAAPAADATMDDYAPRLPNGSAFPVLKVRIERSETETRSLPAQLSTLGLLQIEEAVNAGRPRRIGLSMRDSSWRLNGRRFELEAVADDEIVKLGSVEAWEFVNEQNPGESMEKAGMVHPMHVHGVQFLVAERRLAAPELAAGWDSVRAGYVDEGWKDTVLVMPGEVVRLLMRFDYEGIFLYHCHNLEHEDLGMMRNYQAVA